MKNQRKGKILKALSIWILGFVTNLGVLNGSYANGDGVIVACVTDLHQNKDNLSRISAEIGKLCNNNPGKKVVLALNGDWTTEYTKVTAPDGNTSIRKDADHKTRVRFSSHFAGRLKALVKRHKNANVVLAPGNWECSNSASVDFFFRKPGPGIANTNRIFPVDTLAVWQAYGNQKIYNSARFRRFDNMVVVPYCTGKKCIRYCDFHGQTLNMCRQTCKLLQKRDSRDWTRWSCGGDREKVVRAVKDGLNGITNPILVILSHADLNESGNLLRYIQSNTGNKLQGVKIFLVIGHDHKLSGYNGKLIRNITGMNDINLDVTVVAPKAYGNSMPCIKVDTANPKGILMSSPFDNNN